MNPGSVGNGRPHVFVSVGTDVHPFPRLLGWVSELARSEPELASWSVQRGWTEPTPGLETSDFLGHDDVVKVMAAADVVVCHGGPTTIAEVRRSGRRPLVVPRSPTHGEHVDDHQVLFARRLAASGLVLLAEDRTGFSTLLRRALADPAVLDRTEEGASPAAAAAVFGHEVVRLLAAPARRGLRARRAR